MAAVPGTVLTDVQLGQLPAAGMEVFEPADTTATGLVFHAAHSEMSIDTGGEAQCKLPRGTTEATLVDRYRWHRAHPREPLPDAWNGAVPVRPLDLAAGSALIFEEIKGPATGNPADARPDHRQAVRLTTVEGPEDGGWLVHVTWHPEDALSFDLCLSARTAAPGVPELKASVWHVATPSWWTTAAPSLTRPGTQSPWRPWPESAVATAAPSRKPPCPPALRPSWPSNP
ncbi:hypothetical protein NHF46_06710 [Arthrobacter alpinus]|nr:hypothetical protein [Arthrobacter alpinus]